MVAHPIQHPRLVGSGQRVGCSALCPRVSTPLQRRSVRSTNSTLCLTAGWSSLAVLAESDWWRMSLADASGCAQACEDRYFSQPSRSPRPSHGLPTAQQQPRCKWRGFGGVRTRSLRLSHPCQTPGVLLRLSVSAKPISRGLDEEARALVTLSSALSFPEARCMRALSACGME